MRTRSLSGRPSSSQARTIRVPWGVPLDVPLDVPLCCSGGSTHAG
ncbi:hypothetical protein [Actinophytocola xinjiangensis]|nr:hypothetical protein [Actinophytocola xinjiangensis]